MPQTGKVTDASAIAMIPTTIDGPTTAGPLTWLQVDATRESDGWVFALELVTRMMIERRFATSCRHRRVFVAVESNDDLVADEARFEA